MKLHSTGLVLTVCLLLLQACQNHDCGCVTPPLSSELMGKWEWVKTVTPSRTITPQTTGYTRLFEHENNSSLGDYIAFYQNDSLYLRLTPSRNFSQENREKLTILLQYGSHYLKYYLRTESTNGTHEMQTSEFMTTYSEKADTIRHHYKYIGR